MSKELTSTSIYKIISNLNMRMSITQIKIAADNWSIYLRDTNCNAGIRGSVHMERNRIVDF